MRAVIQRTTGASVEVESEIIGEIKHGLVVFLGIEEGDTESDLNYICDKVVGLRVFDDDNEIPNLSVTDVGGGVLLISQFTLCADARKGRRPSYIKAARPETAVPLYEAAIKRIAKSVPVATEHAGAAGQRRPAYDTTGLKEGALNAADSFCKRFIRRQYIYHRSKRHNGLRGDRPGRIGRSAELAEAKRVDLQGDFTHARAF
jgi:D-tyrosyl-tRNA(Tyr) deacylase